MAERPPADGAAGGSPVDPEAVHAALDDELTAVLRERTTVETFRAWWDRDATRGLMGALTSFEDPRGRKAVDLCRVCRVAVEDHRHGRISDEDLRDLLHLALRDLRG